MASGDPIVAAGDAATGEADANTCAPNDPCKIQYEYLASEETDPYLVYGQQPEKWADKRAARRWPDARSCLIRTERKSEEPDIAKIDWKRMRRAEDIEVCMFRIAASIGGPNGMADWFRAQGLSNIRAGRGDTGFGVTANHNIQQSGKTFLTAVWPLNLLRVWTTYSENFNVVWSLEGELLRVSFDSTIL